MTLKSPSRAACTLTIGMTLLVATTIFAQQLSTPKSDDETTAKLVCSLIKRYHIKREDINDGISARLLKRYVNVLDPQKLYLLQSDLDEMNRQKHELDNQLSAGDVHFAYDAFQTYRERVDERIAYAHQLIDADHDFTLDETMTVDIESLEWAKSTSGINERWRKRVKYDLVRFELDDKPLTEARERLHKRYATLLRTVHETDESEILEMYLSALTHCFDPHSSYMSPQTLEEFRISMELSLDGIGAALRSEDGYTTVAQIVPGGAADADGRLKVGDKITGVGQAEGDIVDIIEMKLSKVVRLIRGKRGTRVRLQVTTGETNDQKIYELTRKKIELKSAEVKGEIINSKERLGDQAARIGVINIPSFYRDFRGAQNGVEDFKSTARDVLKVLYDFRDAGGVDGIIIDLRTNGGGALSEAIEVSGLFIDEGPVVQVKEQNGKIKSHDDNDAGAAYTGPLVVICNRLSASASEIFAGVIKDYGRGIVVGDTTTHGKGTVQSVMPVSRQLFQFLNPQDRGAVKLTINQFYRVNGDSTQNQGVRSDVVLPSMIDHMDLGESFLDNALAFDKVPPAHFAALGMVTPDMVTRLQQTSKKRISANKDFAELQHDITKYLERKNRKVISLNEEVLRKERDADKKADEVDEKVADPEADGEAPNPDGPVFPDNFYNNEVLSISLDYISLLKYANTAQR